MADLAGETVRFDRDRRSRDCSVENVRKSKPRRSTSKQRSTRSSDFPNYNKPKLKLNDCVGLHAKRKLVRCVDLSREVRTNGAVSPVMVKNALHEIDDGSNDRGDHLTYRIAQTARKSFPKRSYQRGKKVTRKCSNRRATFSLRNGSNVTNGLINDSVTKSPADFVLACDSDRTFHHRLQMLKPKGFSRIPVNFADPFVTPLVLLDQLTASENHKFESNKSPELNQQDIELEVLLPEISEMEMVLQVDHSWHTDYEFVSPDMPRLSPEFDDERRSRSSIIDFIDKEDEDAPALTEDFSFSIENELETNESKSLKSKMAFVRPFGNRKAKSWMHGKKASQLSCPDIDFIDGLEILSFESEDDLDRFIRNNSSTAYTGQASPPKIPELMRYLLNDEEHISVSNIKCLGQPIVPSKTLDITLIKGWRNKVFSAEALIKCRLNRSLVQEMSSSQPNISSSEEPKLIPCDENNVDCPLTSKDFGGSGGPSTSKDQGGSLSLLDIDGASTSDSIDIDVVSCEPTDPVEKIEEIYNVNTDESESYLLDDFLKKSDVEDPPKEFDRQSIESIDLGIFKNEPFDDDDFIEQPTAEIPDPLPLISPNPECVQEECSNKSVFVSDYLTNFLQSQSEFSVNLSKSMEDNINPDDIQTKVVWPTQEMPVENRIPAPLFVTRFRQNAFVPRRPRMRVRRSVGRIRGPYNKKFKLSVTSREIYLSNSIEIPERQSTSYEKPIIVTNGVQGVTISRDDALFAVSALIQSHVENRVRDDFTDISETMNQPCMKRPNRETVIKHKCEQFSVLMTDEHISNAVKTVVNNPAEVSQLQFDVISDSQSENPPKISVKLIRCQQNDITSEPAWRTSPTSSPEKIVESTSPVEISDAIVTVTSVCGETFCQLGCVCDSLKVRKRRRGHCGKVECMFGCKCDSSFGMIGNMDIEGKSENCDDTLRVKRHRQIKVPARLRDSVYFYKEDKKTVQLSPSKLIKRKYMSIALSPPPPPPPTMMVTNKSKVRSPVSPYIKNRPQMYPLAFRQSKINDKVRRDAILNIRPIKEISRVEAAAYGHLLQSDQCKNSVKRGRPRQDDIFKPALGIKPRMLLPKVSLNKLDTFGYSVNVGSSPRVSEKVPVSLPQNINECVSVSMSASNRPKMTNLQNFKFLHNPVVKSAATRSIPAILRKSGFRGPTSSQRKNGPLLSASACTGTVQRAILQHLCTPTQTAADANQNTAEDLPVNTPMPTVARPVSATVGFQTARKSLNPSAKMKHSNESAAAVALKAAVDRDAIIIKNLMEEIVRKVDFRLESAETWQILEQMGRAARMSCPRSSSSPGVIQPLPPQKRLENQQQSNQSYEKIDDRDDKLSRLEPVNLQNNSSFSKPIVDVRDIEDNDDENDDGDDDEVMCLGSVSKIHPELGKINSGAGPSNVTQVHNENDISKNTKAEREQKRRDSILIAFTNLAMVSSPIVKDIWTKKDESVPITAFVFKMACTAIERLKEQDKKMTKLTQLMVMRRQLLLQKYSEYLKDFDLATQKQALQIMSTSLSDCCSDRNKISSSSLQAVVDSISDIDSSSTKGSSKTNPSTSTKVPSSTWWPAATKSSLPSPIRPVTVAPQNKINNGSSGSVQSDKRVNLNQLRVPITDARFGEGDPIGKVGTKRILVGEPVFIGGRTSTPKNAKPSQTVQNKSVALMKTIRLQRPAGRREWVSVPMNVDRVTKNVEASKSNVDDRCSQTNVVKGSAPGMVFSVTRDSDIVTSNVVKTTLAVINRSAANDCPSSKPCSSTVTTTNTIRLPVKPSTVIKPAATIELPLKQFSNRSVAQPIGVSSGPASVQPQFLIDYVPSSQKLPSVSNEIKFVGSQPVCLVGPITSITSSVGTTVSRPTIDLQLSKEMTVTSASLQQTTGGLTLQALPINQVHSLPNAFKNAKKVTSGGKTFFINVVPTVVGPFTSLNGITTTTLSMTNAGVVRSNAPAVNVTSVASSEGKLPKLLKFPLPPGSQSFALDTKNRLLILKHAQTADQQLRGILVPVSTSTALSNSMPLVTTTAARTLVTYTSSVPPSTAESHSSNVKL